VRVGTPSAVVFAAAVPVDEDESRSGPAVDDDNDDEE
jgi:hypothetical protein